MECSSLAGTLLQDLRSQPMQNLPVALLGRALSVLRQVTRGALASQWCCMDEPPGELDARPPHGAWFQADAASVKSQLTPAAATDLAFEHLKVLSRQQRERQHCFCAM